MDTAPRAAVATPRNYVVAIYRISGPGGILIEVLTPQEITWDGIGGRTEIIPVALYSSYPEELEP